MDLVGVQHDGTGARAPDSLWLHVNDEVTPWTGDPAQPLLWALREVLGLTGTKFGCGEGNCGACTVLVDGEKRHACTLTVGEAAGHAVRTIEGLAGTTLHPVQAAWLRHGAGQCGYCQPGMIMAALALLDEHPDPDDAQVAAALTNLCRCAGYGRVREAVRAVDPDEAPGVPLPEDRAETFTAIGPWVAIGSLGSTRIHVSQSEMGQGSSTGLAMLVAEELDCDWAGVRVALATGQDAYRITLLGYTGQFVGGSLSTTLLHERLRRAGAAVRAVLVAAAAARLGVVPEACRTRNGRVLHAAGGTSLTYAELATLAATLPLPESPPLKDPADFVLIGTPRPRLDAPGHVTGRSRFGMDVMVPGMLVGAVRHAGGFGSKVVAVDDAAARAIPGIEAVVPLEDAVVVLARGYWEAQRGADALVITADEAAGRGLSTAAIFAANRAALAQPDAVVAVDRGAAPALIATADAARHHTRRTNS